MKIEKEIRDARESLRKIYTKYTEELCKVVTKIDNMLEELEDSKEEIPREN